MPRNMSFSLTTQQMRDRTKTVTRRFGWGFLKPGDTVNACVKCQGLGKGEKVERICQIRVVGVRRERLSEMLRLTDDNMLEPTREGFPQFSQADFVTMFCEHMKCDRSKEVNRIEFEYVD